VFPFAYIAVGVALVNKARCKTALKGQGKATMNVHFVIRVVLKVVLQYKDEALQFKKCVWVLCVEALKNIQL